jgi:hypothetical protein
LNEYGPIESFPKELLQGQRKLALLFKRLATLKSNAPLFKNVDKLKWKGPSRTFERFTARINEPRLLERARKAIKEPD